MGHTVRRRVGAVAILAVLAATGLVVHAQSTSALQGTVTDPQNEVVPGVSVTIRNLATGIERTIQTDAAGQYLAPSLTPGRYRIEARLQGFQEQSQEVELEVAKMVVANFRLAVGAVTEQVKVVGVSPVIETATISVGQVITQRTVQEIPLNGRHFVELGLLVPGSVTPPQNGFLTAPLRGQGSFAFNTAGNREDTVNFMINGINLNDMVQNQITFQPSINTVSEFKVDNSTFSAEYGRNSGAIVNIATRSGSNEIHGEGFEFFRDDSLDARNYFNMPPARKSAFTRNQFGVSMGGPIVKNRTFSSAAMRACGSGRASTSTPGCCGTTSERPSLTPSRGACSRSSRQRTRPARTVKVDTLDQPRPLWTSTRELATGITASAAPTLFTDIMRFSAIGAANRPSNISNLRFPDSATRASHIDKSGRSTRPIFLETTW